MSIRKLPTSNKISNQAAFSNHFERKRLSLATGTLFPSKPLSLEEELLIISKHLVNMESMLLNDPTRTSCNYDLLISRICRNDIDYLIIGNAAVDNGRLEYDVKYGHHIRNTFQRYYNDHDLRIFNRHTFLSLLFKAYNYRMFTVNDSNWEKKKEELLTNFDTNFKYLSGTKFDVKEKIKACKSSADLVSYFQNNRDDLNSFTRWKKI